MKSPVIVIGLGEMGSVFARAFLRAGYPVYPVTRDMRMDDVARQIPAPELVLPPAWHGRIALLQNELLPADWERFGLTRPTVISVWFEKKRGQDVKVLIPSPVFGPQAQLLKECLGTLDIPVRVLDNDADLLFELVVKNVYIVTVNCAGMVTGGTVSELWSQHREFAEAVAREVIEIQAAFDGDPDHVCTGRSAPARLARALEQADAAGLAVPHLRKIAARQD
jgi:ketopantoate reductase